MTVRPGAVIQQLLAPSRDPPPPPARQLRDFVNYVCGLTSNRRQLRGLACVFFRELYYVWKQQPAIQAKARPGFLAPTSKAGGSSSSSTCRPLTKAGSRISSNWSSCCFQNLKFPCLKCCVLVGGHLELRHQKHCPERQVKSGSSGCAP